MACCIKTYKEFAPVDSKFANKFGEIIEKITDTCDDLRAWRIKKNWRVILYPITLLYNTIIAFFLILCIVVLNKNVLKLQIIFKEGKEYMNKEIDSNGCVTMFNDERDYITFKTSNKDYFNNIWKPKYQDYFVDNLKKYRKIKIQKLNKK